MIAANQVGEGKVGFESDDNALYVYWLDDAKEFPHASKNQLARQLLSLVAEKFSAQND
jgi:phosphopantothenoylcysteine decarboxylase/phosphopantothenate--cysteine ligase